ncbi:hypothetical protein AGMMS50229_20130 [Campylobacterota bacterium]|nr:hypothetical protein AGMMS50229_20130 [Campylobacterota bacterium]
MACMWIEKYKETPPMEFEKLLEQITDKALLDKINELLIRKRNGIEMGLEPKIEIINNFVDDALKHFENVINIFNTEKKPEQKILEEGFVKIIDYVENANFFSIAN